MMYEHSPVPILRRIRGGVILLILRNLRELQARLEQNHCRRNVSECWSKLKRALECVVVVTSAEKSFRRFFVQFSSAFLELPLECLPSVKLRSFLNESSSFKLSGVSPLLRHSSSLVLWPGLKTERTKFIQNTKKLSKLKSKSELSFDNNS